jgi:hypothetical protein
MPLLFLSVYLAAKAHFSAVGAGGAAMEAIWRGAAEVSAAATLSGSWRAGASAVVVGTG